MSESVLILGASGFIGKSLSEYLSSLRVEVKGLSSKDVNLENSESATELADYIKNYSILVMSSALTPEKGTDFKTWMRNMKMAETTCEALHHSVPKQLVFISSDAVYASDSEILSEESLCDPDSLHGLMCLAREKLFYNVSRVMQIPFLTIRPCAVYGPGDTHNVYGPNRFLRQALNGEDISLFGEGEEKRDHIFVRDLVKIIHQCLTQKTRGILNIATGKSISFKDIADLAINICGNKALINHVERSNPIQHKYFDNKKLKEMIGDDFFTPMEDALNQMKSAIEKGSNE